MIYKNEYKVVFNTDTGLARRASNSAYMSKHGITKESHEEFDWGYTDGTYSALTTTWVPR